MGIHAALAELPGEALALFGAAQGYGMTRNWFAATEAAALPGDARAAYVAVGGELLVPMVWRGRRLLSMTTPYTWEFAPLLRPGAAPGPAMAAFARACRAAPVVMLEALDPEAETTRALEAGLRRAGRVVRRFAHFGNWSEAVGGRDWPAYLAARPGALRETLRRRWRDAGDRLRPEMITAASDIERGIAAYEQVYARSWKVPEPFAGFGPALMRAAAAEGALRLAVLWQGEAPVAAQYWVLHAGVASVLKLAHDEAHRALSPGTLLTGWAIRQLIERDGVRRLDFGRGDDGYKRQWAGERRARIGLLAGLPWHPLGAAALARQMGGEARRWLMRRGREAAA